tara:strand:+ start:323 stop:715 length:393 start_codon:yes stop_codon:yes gene_type:complete
MEEIIQYVLLAIVVMLVYKKPECLKALVKNKVLLIGLILLNVHLTVTYGASCGVLGSVIIIMLMDSDGYQYKEAFNPKLEVWKPKEFTQACVSDIDRNIKIKSESNSMLASKQIDNHTNGGFKDADKQLY